MINQKLDTFMPLTFISGCFCVGISVGLWIRVGYINGWDSVTTPQPTEPQLPQITLPPALQEQLIEDDLTIKAQAKQQRNSNPQKFSAQAIPSK